MSNVGRGPGDQEAPGKPKSLAKTLVLLAVVMSGFAYFRLSNGKFVIPEFIAVLSILEIYGLVKGIKESKVYEALCEIEYFFVLLALLFGAYRGTLSGQSGIAYVTIFYRPQYTVHRNQRLAFTLGLLIMAVTLPVGLGIVMDPVFVELLIVIYGFLVAGLWVFCSKLGAWAFGSAAR
jgi:hypothetical protein